MSKWLARFVIAAIALFALGVVVVEVVSCYEAGECGPQVEACAL